MNLTEVIYSSMIHRLIAVGYKCTFLHITHIRCMVLPLDSKPHDSQSWGGKEKD